MQKVFHKKIGNSLSYAVHMIWRIKDPFWVCILSQNQTKVLWTKAVTWQMTRERWQIDLPWHSFQQKTQYLYWKVMGVCFSHSVIGVESHQCLSVEISPCSSFDLFLLLFFIVKLVSLLFSVGTYNIIYSDIRWELSASEPVVQMQSFNIVGAVCQIFELSLSHCRWLADVQLVLWRVCQSLRRRV